MNAVRAHAKPDQGDSGFMSGTTLLGSPLSAIVAATQ
jgi:hypothetical protein